MMSLHREAGVVMITALLFLFVMTLLGVAAMQSSLLQERMAGHLRDSHMAFQAAESALRGGEAWLDSSATNRATAEGNCHSRPLRRGMVVVRWGVSPLTLRRGSSPIRSSTLGRRNLSAPPKVWI